ncbi:MAG: prolipoprotein diacylglyceryl transferase [Bacillota bacterium]|nr:prolipoprotein diacylglyceryl transferase [Bacillota bacterium]
MNPIAFTIFGLSIRWYGILIATGIVLALIVASYTCKLKEVNYDSFTDMAIILLPFAFIGARLYYVIFNFSYYSANPSNILNFRQGGLAIHGGVIAGIITAAVYTRIKKKSFFKYADAAAPSLILAQAIGRWGNFFNGEAHGGPVSEGFISHFPEFIQKGMYIDGVYYHPTFLYESMWNLLVFAILLLVTKKKPKDGTIIFLYLGLYSTGRFFIEGLRTDSLMLGPLRIAQVVSLCGIALCLGYLFVTYGIRRKPIE